MPEVTIDTREPWEKAASHFSRFDVDSRVDTLNENSGHPKADFLIELDEGETFGIQRKSANDFVSTMTDGDRDLKRDLFQLRNYHDHSALLIEGFWKFTGSQIALRRGRSYVQTGLSARSWHNFVLSQQIRGTMYVHTTEFRETCAVVAWFADYMGGSPTPPVASIEDPATVLQILPGIGPELADRIEARFDNPFRAMMNLDRWQQEVEGIGPKKYVRVKEFLKRQNDD